MALDAFPVPQLTALDEIEVIDLDIIAISGRFSCPREDVEVCKADRKLNQSRLRPLCVIWMSMQEMSGHLGHWQG